jgi:ATP-dependent Clp protease ATP-binding subunit ClpA
MYERFTDRARKVMQLANQEAQRFNHEYIGTEHILLGLCAEGGGVAATVLKNRGVDVRKIRLEVEKIIQPGPDTVPMGKLPQTPRAKKVIELAIEAARELGNNHVGTEHLMIGLLREDDGVAHTVLQALGIKEEAFKDLGLILGVKLTPEEEVDVRTLVAAKEAAIQAQDFQRAMQLRDQIERLKKNEKVSKITEDADGSLKTILKQVACVLFLHFKGDWSAETAVKEIRQLLEEGR